MNKNIKVNTILNIIKVCSTIIFPLITFPYVSRVLLPQNIGRVNICQSFVNYFSLVAGLGLSTYAIRECAEYRDEKDHLSVVASELFSINMITTVISYLLMALTLLIFREYDEYRSLILIEASVIIFATLGADWLNSAMEDFKYIALRTVAFQFISLILLFSFVKSTDDLFKYAIISVVSSSGANIANIIYRRRYCKIRFTLNIDWKKHLPPIFLRT